MLPRHTIVSQNKTKTKPPAKTLEARENQMIEYAVDLAERQLRDGTASSQVITHFLKLGTQNERMARDLLEEEIKLKRAKTEQIKSAARTEELFTNAINAMRTYSGAGNKDDEDEHY